MDLKNIVGIVILVMLVLFILTFLTKKSLASIPTLPTPTSTSRIAGAPTESCVPRQLSTELSNQFKQYIPLEISEKLTKLGPINYSYKMQNSDQVLTITSTSPLQMGELLIDEFNSSTCGDEVDKKSDISITVNGYTTLRTTNLTILLSQPIIEETIGLAVFDIQMSILISANQSTGEFKINSIDTSNVTLPMPDSKISNSLIVPIITPAITAMISEMLSGSIVASPSSKLTALTVVKNGNGLLRADPLKDLLNKFLTDVVNTIVSSSIVKNVTFKVCDNCPNSTIDKIELGKEVWKDAGDCEGFRISGECVGCSWGYRAGVNSIQGLGGMKLKSLQLGSSNFVSSKMEKPE